MMDIVGYSSLIQQDRSGTVRRLQPLWQNCVAPAIDRHRGRVYRKSGDGFLAEFRVAREALACAIEIQDAVAASPEEPALRYRGGIDAGEIEVTDDLHAHAANIAARLQELAAPGGIIISATVERLARGSIDRPLADLGEIALKNIERRVRAYSLLERPDWSLAAGRPSIAVLPFTEDDATNGDYFGDGIVDNIVNSLAALSQLFVVSRSSTLSFRRGAADLRKVRQALGVRYVVSGRVRRSNDRIRISADLSDSESLAVLWSDRIDGHCDDIFEAQDRVARQIVGVIAPRVHEAEITRISSKRPENFNAYDCFLRGLDLLYRLEHEQFEGAGAMFDDAMRMDRRYAAPYAYKALWYAIRIGQGWSKDRKTDRTEMKRLADAALERDQLDPAALALCGHVKSMHFRQYEEALAHFRDAIAASPNSAIAWTRSSATYSYLGQWQEGLRRGLKGLDLSPLDRHRFFTYTILGLAAYTGEQYDEAIRWGEQARMENPRFTANLRLLCAALSAEGLMDAAREVAESLVAAEPDFNVGAFCNEYAYQDPALRERLAGHLRAVGLPG